MTKKQVEDAKRDLIATVTYDTALVLALEIEENCDSLEEIELVLKILYEILAIRYPKIKRG